MKKTYRKLLFRGVKSSFARFLSIFGIVAVGAGFLAGLIATTPDMQKTADQYYDDCGMYDINVRGTLGLTASDAAAISDIPGVGNASGAYVTDAELSCGDRLATARIYGVELERANKDGFINGFRLVSGRMPENSSECLIAFPNSYLQNFSINEKFVFSSDNKNYETLSDTYTIDSFTAVGIVETPQYMSVESEPSTAGKGTVELILYVCEDVYALDCYTDIFLTLDGAKELDSFSKEYENLINEAAAAIEKTAPERCGERYDEIKKRYDDALFEAESEYDKSLGEFKGLLSLGALTAEQSAEYEKNLSAARAELDEMRTLSEELTVPQWYISDRTDNASYASYKGNSEKIDAIAKVFPAFFFLVAALVALTTMTRMVEEERLQIGTLKALGYTKAQIMLYYVGYGVLASALGSLAGVLAGFKMLPAIIANAYGMMYALPETITAFYPGYCVIIVAISVACITAATLGACFGQLSERPSALMLPKAPKAGKRIFLERVGFIWSRMGFIKKVTARIFSGIKSGCT